MNNPAGMDNGVQPFGVVPQSGFAKPMSTSDFSRLSEFILAHCGIKMPLVKKTMLEARLQKRLRSLELTTFHDYCEHLFKSPAGREELVHMINAVTTNKTDFFREAVHFQFLEESILRDMLFAGEFQGGKSFSVWSAGCSSGEEPYTLAMVLSEFRAQHQGFRFSILATDISTRVLEKAQLGIYDMDRVEAVPKTLQQKYLMRSKDRSKDLVRISPELRSLINFQRVNLMDENLSTAEKVDTIFCRNVIIYFERETQEKLLQRLCSSLRVGGHLFLGHSETTHGFDLPLVRIASTIYRKVT